MDYLKALAWLACLCAGACTAAHGRNQSKALEPKAGQTVSEAPSVQEPKSSELRSSEPRASSAPPNIVFVLADDLGWGDLGCTGGPHRTPNLDRMAKEGAFFANFYVAQSLCTGSRASFLTGLYPNRIGLLGALRPGVPRGIQAQQTTLGELFQARGYRTALFGKWHLGCFPPQLPTRHGFDEFAGIPYSNSMTPKFPKQGDPFPPLPSYVQETIVEYDADQSAFTLGFARLGSEFIQKCAAEHKPFFLYVPQPMPHVPLHVSAEFQGHSAGGLYGDTIEELDASVGILLDSLDKAGVRDDTIVVFSSDNGPWISFGDHAGSTGGLREGKDTVFEGGVRVPMLVRYPRAIAQRTIVKEPVMSIDLLPTLIEFTGTAPVSGPIDGRDISPLLTGRRAELEPEHAYFFWHGSNELQAMRMGRWKLHFPHRYKRMRPEARGFGGAPGAYDESARTELELYDLDVDPGESRNVAALQPELIVRMQALADQMRARLGDSLTGSRGIENALPGS